jgi:RNA polymerase subunit RPABC4/transcription elongation factor Spt4
MYDDFESEFDAEDEEEWVEKLHNCFSCHREVGEDFKYCPYCSTQLKTDCTGCHKEIQTNWNTCPYCWEDQKVENTQTNLIQDEKNEIIKQDEVQSTDSSSDTGSSSSD